MSNKQSLKTLRKLLEDLDTPESEMAKKKLPHHDLGLGKEVPDHLEDKRGALDKGESEHAKKFLPTHDLELHENEKHEDEDQEQQEMQQQEKKIQDEEMDHEEEKAEKHSCSEEGCSVCEENGVGEDGSPVPAEKSHLDPDHAEDKLHEEEDEEDMKDEKKLDEVDMKAAPELDGEKIADDRIKVREEKEEDMDHDADEDEHKSVMKEHIEKLLEGQSDLSEDLKQKTVGLFEAAVNAGVKNQTKRIRKIYESRLKKEAAKTSAHLIEAIDTYLNNAVEVWLDENKLAVESGLHAELAERLLEDIRGVFNKHNVELPKNKINLFDKLAEQVAILESKLDKEISKTAQLSKQLSESKKTEIVTGLCEGLSKAECSKLKLLAEGVSFDSSDSFSKKISSIKDTYFPGDKKVAAGNGVNLLIEEGGIEKANTGENSLIDAAADSISRQVKKV